MEEYIAELTEQVAQLGMGMDDTVKIAEAFAAVDQKKTRVLDIDDLGKLLEEASMPLPGFKIRQLIPGIKMTNPGELTPMDFGKVILTEKRDFDSRFAYKNVFKDFFLFIKYKTCALFSACFWYLLKLRVSKTYFK